MVEPKVLWVNTRLWIFTRFCLRSAIITIIVNVFNFCLCERKYQSRYDIPRWLIARFAHADWLGLSTCPPPSSRKEKITRQKFNFRSVFFGISTEITIIFRFLCDVYLNNYSTQCRWIIVKYTGKLGLENTEKPHHSHVPWKLDNSRRSKDHVFRFQIWIVNQIQRF